MDPSQKEVEMSTRNALSLQPRVKGLSLIVWLTVAVLVSASCASPPPDVGCQITSHTDGEPVGRHITVEGTSSGMEPEWSMYSYARAKLPGEPWWLSDKKATVIGDNWSVDVVIGNDQTPHGTEFQVAIVVANKDLPATTDDLPASVLPCAQVNLVRE